MKSKNAGRSFKAWFEERLGLSAVMNFLRKKTVPLNKHTIWSYTGSSILLFLGIQVVTGIMLAFYYKPTLEEEQERGPDHDRGPSRLDHPVDPFLVRVGHDRHGLHPSIQHLDVQIISQAEGVDVDERRFVAHRVLGLRLHRISSSLGRPITRGDKSRNGHPPVHPHRGRMGDKIFKGR